MCDNFVANMYGYGASGYATAQTHWDSIPGASRHPGDMNAPAGSLMFWQGGSSGDGHVAISDGAGGIYSTDIGGAGTVSHVPASAISQKWGLGYLGWTPPIFQGQSGDVGGTSAASATPAFNPLTTSPGSALLDFLTNKLNQPVKEILQRGALILFGGVLIVVGLIAIGRNPVKAVVQNAQGAQKAGLRTANREVKGSENALPDIEE